MPERGPYAEETAQQIDAEVKRISPTRTTRRAGVLRERRDILESCRARLLEKEVIEGDELRALHGPGAAEGSRRRSAGIPPPASALPLANFVGKLGARARAHPRTPHPAAPGAASRRRAATRRATPPGNASISGRVYSAATGTPFRGALVILLPSSTLVDPTSFRLPPDAAKSALPPTPPAFETTSVVPGVYYVVAIPSSYGGRHLAGGYGAVRGNDPGKPITIAGGADVRGVDIALSPSLAIEGRVIDEAGEPLSRMPVFAARLMPGSDTALRLPSLSDVDRRSRTVSDLRPRARRLSRRGGRPWRRDLRRIVRGPRLSSSRSSGSRNRSSMTFHPSALTESEGQPSGWRRRT